MVQIENTFVEQSFGSFFFGVFVLYFDLVIWSCYFARQTKTYSPPRGACWEPSRTSEEVAWRAKK